MGIQLLLKSILAGAILALGLFFPALAFFYVPGYALLFYFCFHDSLSFIQVFILASLSVLIQFGLNLYWLILYSPFVFIVSLFISTFVTVFYFLIVWKINRRRPPDSFVLLIMIPLLWIAYSKCASFFSMPRIALEAPFQSWAALNQTASLTESPLVGALTLGLAAGLAMLVKQKKRNIVMLSVFFALLLVLSYFWGSHRLNASAPPPKNGTVKVALLQHNLPFDGEWRFDHPAEIENRYEEFATQALTENPDLLIFPLYSFPGDIYRKGGFFKQLAQKTGKHILVASHVPAKENESILEGFSNRALLFGPNGTLIGSYQAVTSPPFSEVTEYRAEQYEVLESPFGKIGILLCFEDTVSSMAKKAALQGAELIVALSNPSLFLKTVQPRHHLKQDQMRAIESGKELIRVSASGPSAIMDAKGVILKRSQTGKEEIIFGEISRTKTRTLRYQYSDFISLISVLALAFILMKQKKETGA
jgi:apolipoprotein N-acyltransferase